MSSHRELLLDVLQELGSQELKKFQWFLRQAGGADAFAGISKSELEEADMQDTVDLMVQTYGLPAALHGSAQILEKISRNDLVQLLTQSAPETKDLLVQGPKPWRNITSYQHALQLNLHNKFMCVPEGSSKQKDKKLLDQVYTELYIIDGNVMDVNTQHEVRQVEATSRKPDRTERSIQHNEIFKHPSGEDTPVRTVLTNGIAGIGKTFLVNKFILDWTEGRANQDVHLIFPFTFRQLNLLSGRRFLLAELVHKCIQESRDIHEDVLGFIFAALQASGNTNYNKTRFKLLFVLDGLDESRLQLNFSSTEECSSEEPLFLNDLLANLIKGKLLPSARLWITTRPAAANQIPPEFVDIVTEVRGFTDSQKEDYFRRRFSDQDQASRIISHIKTSRSLHIMCHIPVFCWITASVLKQMFLEDEGREVPQTLTEMYTKFLVFQIKQMALKFDQNKNLEVIRSLAKLAFRQLEMGNIIFYETDLEKSGICPHEASVYSGVFTQIFKEEDGLNEDKMFCFVHLSIHEFLAAVFVILSVFYESKDVITKPKTLREHLKVLLRKTSITEVCMKAVDQALQSPNGHLDLFLRFLMGLTLKSNQDLLQGLLKPTEDNKGTQQRLVKYIKTKISESPSPERCINLLHCLSELKDSSLVEEVRYALRRRSFNMAHLSPAQWSALVYMLLTSEEDLQVFDLIKYSKSGDVLLRILPLVKASTTALLTQCELSERSCEALASVLSSPSCNLKKLDLSGSRSVEVQLLCAGLKNPNCSLQELRLPSCGLKASCCRDLALALSFIQAPQPCGNYRKTRLPTGDKQAFSPSGVCSQPSGFTDTCCHCQHSSLRDLDLSHNDLTDVGLNFLCEGLKSPHCRLETLRMSMCGLTERGCASLGPVLDSKSCSLKILDLSNNDLQSSGVQLLADGLESPHCGLETLNLSGCLVTEDGFAALASALSINPSHLKDLDLSYNNPGDLGGGLLSIGLKDPLWKLENLRLDHCGELKLTPGLKKYACRLKLDPNTANKFLTLSHADRRVTRERREQRYQDHPDRFEYRYQVLCKPGLTGRCYWEVDWKGQVFVGVTYLGINRRGRQDDSLLGWNQSSWCLDCKQNTAWHRGTYFETSAPLSQRFSRVGVYLDWPGGTLSFYKVSANTRTHLHTFFCPFTEPLYPAFMVLRASSSADLSQGADDGVTGAKHPGK